jgi:predicted DNA-binding protein
MSQSVLVELDLPADWKTFRMPPALDKRLEELLDRLDREGKLPVRERREAAALAELGDMLSLLKLRAEVAARQKRK